MISKIDEKFCLKAPGMNMPIVGLGTWQSSEEEMEAILNAALEAGYRHIDTAYVYMNEKSIGNVLKKWIDSGKIKREELFIVTKLPNVAMHEKCVETSIKESLEALNLSYVDLYLIHHPVGLVRGEGLLPRDEKGNVKVDPSTDHIAIWKAMEAQVDAGRAKAIGVSNFNIRQVDRLLSVARIPPVNLQVELHLYLQQKDLQAWSKRTGVSLCAFAPLGSPGLTSFIQKFGGSMDVKEIDPLSDPVVSRIAQAHHKSAAQVLLRHLIQLGIAVIPKSVNPERIRHNFQVFDFELSEVEMEELNALDKGEDGRKFIGGLLVGIEIHPEYPFSKQ